MIIYKAANKINGKIYVGQTTKNLNYRKKRHEWDKTGYPFSNAMLKYGKDNFIWEILEYCDSKEELDEMEFHYIKQYGSIRPGGYNITSGGEGTPGRVVSDETRIKMSNAKLGKKLPPFSKEHRIKMSKSKMGDKNPNYGVPMPDHVKQMLIKINKEKTISNETRQKMSHAAKNRSEMSYETRIKLSIARSKMIGALNPLSKKYVITTPLKEKFIVNGLFNFCKKFELEKLNQSNLCAVANGKLKQYKGYKCRHYDEKSDRLLSTWGAD